MATHLNKAIWAELIAAAHFARRGWSIFRPLSGHGPCDFVASRWRGKGYEIKMIEVKYLDLDGKQQKRRSIPPTVVHCYVHSDGSVECHLTSKRNRPNADE